MKKSSKQKIQSENEEERGATIWTPELVPSTDRSIFVYGGREESVRTRMVQFVPLDSTSNILSSLAALEHIQSRFAYALCSEASLFLLAPPPPPPPPTSSPAEPAAKKAALSSFTASPAGNATLRRRRTRPARSATEHGRAQASPRAWSLSRVPIKWSIIAATFSRADLQRTSPKVLDFSSPSSSSSSSSSTSTSPSSSSSSSSAASPALRGLIVTTTILEEQPSLPPSASSLPSSPPSASTSPTLIPPAPPLPPVQSLPKNQLLKMRTYGYELLGLAAGVGIAVLLRSKVPLSDDDDDPKQPPSKQTATPMTPSSRLGLRSNAGRASPSSQQQQPQQQQQQQQSLFAYQLVVLGSRLPRQRTSDDSDQGRAVLTSLSQLSSDILVYALPYVPCRILAVTGGFIVYGADLQPHYYQLLAAAPPTLNGRSSCAALSSSTVPRSAVLERLAAPMPAREGAVVSVDQWQCTDDVLLVGEGRQNGMVRLLLVGGGGDGRSFEAQVILDGLLTHVHFFQPFAAQRERVDLLVCGAIGYAIVFRDVVNSRLGDPFRLKAASASFDAICCGLAAHIDPPYYAPTAAASDIVLGSSSGFLLFFRWSPSAHTYLLDSTFNCGQPIMGIVHLSKRGTSYLLVTTLFGVHILSLNFIRHLNALLERIKYSSIESTT